MLVTDGIEECRGDPCAAADRLSALGIGVKVHVVGFALQPGESSSLQCVVDKTGGRYFDARDADALKRTFAEVRQIVIAQTPSVPPPTLPSAPKAKVYFEDPFDGTKLGELWDVANKKEANFGVEKGELLTMVTGEAGFRHAPSSNRFQLKKELPGGAIRDLVLDMRAEFSTGRERRLAWRLLGTTRISLARISGPVLGYCSEFVVSIIKRTDGEESLFNKRIAGSRPAASARRTYRPLSKFAEKGGKLVLSKRGRRVHRERGDESRHPVGSGGRDDDRCGPACCG